MKPNGSILHSCLTLLLCVRVTSPALIPHGVSATTLPVNEDFFNTVTIPTFQFFGSTYTTVHIQENGVLTFDAIPFGGTPASYTLATKWISPFGADIGGGSFGNILHETFSPSDSAQIEFVSTAVNGTFSGESFVPTSVFVATWRDVRLYPSATNSEQNTFQAVLTTDGTTSYVLFVYDTLQWSPAVIQISAGDNASFHKVCQSSIYDAKFLTSMSQKQCGVEGVVAFRVDNSSWQPSGYSCTGTYPPGKCSAGSSSSTRRCSTS